MNGSRLRLRRCAAEWFVAALLAATVGCGNDPVDPTTFDTTHAPLVESPDAQSARDERAVSDLCNSQLSSEVRAIVGHKVDVVEAYASSCTLMADGLTPALKGTDIAYIRIYLGHESSPADEVRRQMEANYANVRVAEFGAAPALLPSGSFELVTGFDGYSAADNRDVIWERTVHLVWPEGGSAGYVAVTQHGLDMPVDVLRGWSVALADVLQR